MDKKIKLYIDNLFQPYEGPVQVTELKNDVTHDLQECYFDLIKQGKDEETAFQETINGIGDMEETLKEMTQYTSTTTTDVNKNFNASDLKDSDFSHVQLHGGKLNASNLENTDFTGADLTGSSFKSSNLISATFNRANLTNCTFSTLNLNNATFDGSIINRTNFSKSDLSGVVFKNINFIDVDFSISSLRDVTFEHCTFDGGNFDNTDLTGVSFKDQIFRNVYLGKACLTNVSFAGATLKNVSFKPRITLTGKYYKTLLTINFNDAFIDKLTYNTLKGYGVELSNVTLL